MCCFAIPITRRLQHVVVLSADRSDQVKPHEISTALWSLATIGVAKAALEHPAVNDAVR